MKKLFTYLIISLYLLGSTEAYQLLKIGNLIEHYLEHKDANELSLLEFLDLHYVQPTQVDDDYTEDMKLPFKSHSECHAQTTPIAKTNIQEIIIDVPYIETSELISEYKSPKLGSQYLDDIFQPPRVNMLVC